MPGGTAHDGRQAQVVVVVPARHDEPGAYPHDLHVARRQLVAGVGVTGVIAELGDDDLGVGGRVDRDVDRLKVQRELSGAGEVLAHGLATVDPPDGRGQHRVFNHNIRGVRLGELRPAAGSDPLQQVLHDLGR